ncbi:MAG: acyltransferase [Undibacterium sp.]|nr:acyltransferase [Opitutaceae bacterium]
MDPAPVARPPRFWSLDVLRGCCALIVFLSHWHLWSNFVPRGVFERGLHATLDTIHDATRGLTWPTGGHHPAVLGFFVLSGFCIHYPYEWRRHHGQTTTPAWGDYFRNRFRRIMPVYWVACLLGLAFVAAQTLHPAPDALVALHAESPWRHIAVRFVGIAGLFPEEIFAGNYLLNTVAVEMVMYALYPLIHRFAARGAWRGLGLTFLALHGFAIALLPWVTAYWVFNSVFMLGIFWYAGALAAHLFVARGWRATGAQLGLAWACFLAAKLIPPFYGLTLVKQAAWGLVCMLGISWVLRREERIPSVGASRPIRALRLTGQLSYALYAVHTPIIMLVTWALLSADLRSYALQLTLTLAASLAATCAVYYGVERKFYRPRVV